MTLLSVHRCHAHACKKACKPERLMCLAHWRMVPGALQRAVWVAYREGQCDDKNPSAEWHVAADRAIAAVAREEGFEAAADHYERKADELAERELRARAVSPQRALPGIK